MIVIRSVYRRQLRQILNWLADASHRRRAHFIKLISLCRAPLALMALIPLLISPAQADGLDNVKTILGKVKGELLNMIPLIAVVALIVMGIGYALRFVGKETFIRWMVGLIIAGSAAQITTLFFQTTGQNIGLR